jgi:hypothetical protein
LSIGCGPETAVAPAIHANALDTAKASALKAADDGEPVLGVAGVSMLLCPGEFNRSTQHYSPKLSGVGLKQFLH